MIDKYPSVDGDPSARLARVLERDRALLETLCTYDGPLTIEALGDIDPRFMAPAEKLRQSALQWPDEQSAVSVAHDSPIRAMSGKDADAAFVTPIISEGARAYNNYYVILTYEPVEPSEGVLRDAFSQGMARIYRSKPYLVRAHALLPEFMESLQQSVEETGGMARYSERLLDGYIDPSFNTGEAALLTASRMAYTLMTRLMRTDDLRIQHAMLRMPADSASLIDDPAVELRT